MPGLGVDEFTVGMARKLIGINSENPPGREEEIASFVAERLSELGLKAWIDRFGNRRANAIGVYRWGEGERLLLITHLDTVPAGEGWSRPPFSGALLNGRIYGRGAADAKGALAAMLGALKAVIDSEDKLMGELIFAAVADEEADSEGVKRLLSQGLRADHAIVGEPTDLQVCTAHKGRLVISAIFRGKSSHSSAPNLGVNAIYAASDFALRLRRISEGLPKGHPLLDSATIAPTLIRGGARDNVIPDQVELIIDRRTLPEEGLIDVVNMLRWEAERVAASWGARAEVRVRRWIPPAETKPFSKIASAALEAVSEVLGVGAEPRGFNATCDMSFLVREAGIPSIILGPGSLAQAHAVDEWISVDQLSAAARIYSRIISKILGPRD